jgi:hypothetical protein
MSMSLPVETEGDAALERKTSCRPEKKLDQRSPAPLCHHVAKLRSREVKREMEACGKVIAPESWLQWLLK